MSQISRAFVVACFAAVYLGAGGILLAQSTGAIQGTVSDPTNAPIPNAGVTIKDQRTGAERTLAADSSGLYFSPSLPVGTYRIEVRAPGMATMTATDVEVQVGSTVRQDFTLKVASTSEVIEVHAGAPVIDASTISVGQVVNQTTVQEIPLNGRHFVDLSLLTVGTVTPPANGFLTAPLRGQGSFSFNSAGAREDSVNFMVNGINLSDPSQNQITFQPTINTVDSFKVDNSTFSAEYGRNSGSIVNIATRSGVNAWHGEAYEFLRNNYFDARNFSNPTMVMSGGALVRNPMSPFIRNQFGGDGGGAIKKDKAFMFLSYEGLRQRQSVPLSSQTLTVSQVAQAQASSDPIIKSLLPFIPAPNSGTNQFVGSAVAPVNIEQGTANVSYVFSDANRISGYYAIQQDQRNEPPSTQNNSFPGGGDQRNGRRQLLTINDSWVISPTMVNELRAGYNRIHIVFAGQNMENPAAYGMNVGVNAPIGLPQMTVSGAFTFGGVAGFPQGRGDNTIVLSDTVSWIHGNHTVKWGGEFRRANSDNFSYTPGTVTFPSIAAFLADQATGFTANPFNRSNRTYVNSIGAFITDSWKVSPALMVQLGIRYDWYGTPTEAQNRFVVFDPVTVTLQHVGQSSGPSYAYNQNAKNFEPRVGLVWDPFRNGKTIIRSGYAIMTDQPTLNLLTGTLPSNPPNAFPVSFAPSALIPYVSLANAFPAAGGSVAPLSVAHGYKDAYVSEWNFNIQQKLGNDYGVMIGYFGSKGSHLNIERNYNQPVSGVKPYSALSANSPIDPGLPLSNIFVYESVGNSSYHGLWVTGTKSVGKGLQFNVNYALSKSIDQNSRNQQGYVVQDSYNLSNERGLSDFDVRQRVVVSGVWDLPFRSNRLVDGWQMSLIEQTQTGNPINFLTSVSGFTGQATLRPSVTGPVQTGFQPATNGSATTVTYILNPSVLVNQGNAFGNLGRNVVIGPGFSNLDFSLVKNTKITEHLTWRIQADAFDILNQTNFTQPVRTVGSATLGLITAGTRFPAGDGGTSRQLQLAMKLIF
jgi:hypothetical protein